MVQIVKPISQIGADGEMTLFKGRKYFWPDMSVIDLIKKGDKWVPENETEDLSKKTDKTTGRLIFQWRKKPGSLFAYNDPFAQIWVPGNTITSITNPGTIDDITDMRILKLMMNADSLTRLMRLALMISIVGIFATVGIAYGLFQVNAALGHQACVIQNATNATAAAMCK